MYGTVIPCPRLWHYGISPHCRSPHPAPLRAIKLPCVACHQTALRCVPSNCLAAMHHMPAAMQGCEGRYCPDTERKSFAATVAKAPDMAAAAAAAGGWGGKSVFQEWLRITTTAAVETELNLQIGTFTLKSNQVMPALPSSLVPTCTCCLVCLPAVSCACHSCTRRTCRACPTLSQTLD